MTSKMQQQAQRWVLEMLEQAEPAAAFDGASHEDALEIGAEVKRLAQVLRAGLAQPAAGEPVRVVAEPGEELSPSNLVGNRIDRMLTIGTRLYTAPPAAAHGDSFRTWLAAEMPAGTVIGDPAWWADRILKRVVAAAHGDGLSFSTVAELAEAIRQVSAYEDLGPELIAEEMFEKAEVVGCAHGDEAVRKMVLPERIDRRQYLGGRGDAVAQGWNDCLNWIDKANAMCGQGDGSG